MTPLRLRMIDAMVLRGFAARTQETYLIAVGQISGDMLDGDQDGRDHIQGVAMV